MQRLGLTHRWAKGLPAQSIGGAGLQTVPIPYPQRTPALMASLDRDESSVDFTLHGASRGSSVLGLKIEVLTTGGGWQSPAREKAGAKEKREAQARLNA